MLDAVYQFAARIRFGFPNDLRNAVLQRCDLRSEVQHVSGAIPVSLNAKSVTLGLEKVLLHGELDKLGICCIPPYRLEKESYGDDNLMSRKMSFC
jgi:hypothetical protein